MNVSNKTWFKNYEAIEDLEAGIVLTGSEAKSLHEGRAKLEAAYVKLSQGEAWLVNAEIFKYKFNGDLEYNATRRRKLLLNRREILRLESKIASQPNLTLIPIQLYRKGHFIKCKIALAKGRNETQKRRLEKAKVMKRNQQKELKDMMKK